MMNESWLGFHTLDVERAIDNLKEIYNILNEVSRQPSME